MEAILDNGMKQSLEQLKTFLLTPVAALEALNVLLQLGMDEWLNRFEVRIVRPKIDYLDPPIGLPGSTIAISGAGFDPEFGLERQKQSRHLP